MSTASFILIFLVLMFFGLPIAFALVTGSIGYFFINDKMFFLQNLAQKLIGGVNQFPLLAIPLFILAGEIMNVGGITQRMVSFSNSLVGHFRGGLAHVNIVSSILFAGLSGSAVADTSALGAILIPAMEKDGYTRRFAAAVTAASSIIGPIIPPSIMAILYAFVMQVSVASLFLAGLIPGLLIGFGLMAMTKVIAEKKNLPPKKPRESLRQIYVSFRKALLPLLTPLIILGGIVAGVFTPTEAAAVAVFYALFLGLLILRTLSLRELPSIFSRAMISASSILFIVAAAFLFAWVITLSGLPRQLATLAYSLTENKYVLLLLVNILLLVVGMFLDAGPAVLIVAPILAPTAVQYGVDPIHFAVVVCVNLSIGLATPPMGLVLFVTASVGRVQVTEIFKDMLPYYFMQILVIVLVTYVPSISLTLPRMFGY